MPQEKPPKTPEEWESFFRRCHAPQVSATVTGKLLECKVKRPSLRFIGGQRGIIREFSPAARLRMLKKFHTVDFDASHKPLFITLTYPDDCCYQDRDSRKVHRMVMARHLERITGKNVPGAWRVEWEVRKSGFWSGVPMAHMHWLIFRHRYIDKDDLRDAWRKTIGASGHVSTHIEAVNKSDAVKMYMAKYISADACDCSLVIAAYRNSVGRQYGWLRHREIPYHEKVDHPTLTLAQQKDLRRLADEQLPWLREGWQESFTLMGQSAVDAGRVLQGDELDSIDEPDV